MDNQPSTENANAQVKPDLISRITAPNADGDSAFLGISIRAWIVSGLSVTICAMSIFKIAVEEPLYSGFMLSLGYYFGNKNPASSMSKATVLLSLICCALTGCINIKTRDFEVKSFANKRTVKTLNYTITEADGSKRTLKLDGYQSDQTEVVNGIIEAGKAAAAAAK